MAKPEPNPQPLNEDAKALLVEEISTGDAASLPGRESLVGPGVEGQSTSLAVEVEREYVAGTLADGLLGYARTLPAHIDDKSQAFGAGLYEEMGRDPHIAGESRVYKLAVLSGGVTLLPALDGKPIQEGEDGYDAALSVRDLCEGAISDMETPLDAALLELLDAFGQGNRVAEVIYREDNAPSLSLPGVPARAARARLTLDKLKLKNREVVAFVVDNRRNHIGFLGALAGRSRYVTRPEAIVDLAHTPNLLPKSKFLTLTWWPKDGDPRGQSQYRPAYDSWWLKQQTLGEFAKYLAQFAGGALVGKTAPKAAPVTRKDANGNLETINPADQLLNTLLQYRNGAALVIPDGASVENLVSPASSSPFLEAIDLFDRQMSKAILGQTLATNEGKHESRAASGNSKDVLDLLVEHGERAVSDMVRRQLLKLFVEINLGPAYLRLLPVCVLSQAEEADWASMASAGASIADKLAPNQWDEFTTRKLGLPQPERVEVPEAVPPTPPTGEPVPGERETPPTPGTKPGTGARRTMPEENAENE
jgi:hypothetical protein